MKPSETKIGMRVVAGEGDDEDTGIVLRVFDDRTVEIGWDQGAQTPCDIASCREIAQR